MAWGFVAPPWWSCRPTRTPLGDDGLSVTAALLSVMRRTDGLLRRGESLSSPPGTTLTIEDNGAVLTMRTEELPTPLFKRRRLPGGSLLQGKSGRF